MVYLVETFWIDAAGLHLRHGWGIPPVTFPHQMFEQVVVTTDPAAAACDPRATPVPAEIPVPAAWGLQPVLAS